MTVQQSQEPLSMVERAARAIIKTRFYDPEPHFYHGIENFYTEMEDEHIAEARDEARAAIEAMRTPTELMKFATGDGPNTSERVYTAMIDAALEEQQ